MLKFLKQHGFIIFILTLLVGFVSFRNFTPGTILTGIDNFHIEFNLKLAWERVIFGVWQEFQGLGLTAGLAHASDLPRILLYSLWSLIVPTQLLRYVYTFYCLWLGVMGSYALFWWLYKSKLGAVSAGLFYMFNLAVVQIFFMPTEMFVTHYGYLPWLIWGLMRYWKFGSKKLLLIYSFILFFSTPQAMTPTLFISFLFLVSIIGLAFLKQWRRLLTSGLVTILLSLYWMLPFVYFTVNRSSVVMQAKINQSFSLENFLQNNARGSWSDVLRLKGVWFEYPDYINGNFVPLLQDWERHIDWWGVGTFSWLIVAVYLVGFISLVRRRQSYGIVWISVAILTIVILKSEQPPFGFLIKILRSQVPLFAEALRMPYTKFSTVFALVLSIGFGWGVVEIGRLVPKLRFITFGLVVAALVIWAKPIFDGKLISPTMRVEIPDAYWQLFSFFLTQPKESRIALLPEFNTQAWQYNSWGYRGSGFLWYGIEQPILDRAFDVWSRENEQFYVEYSNAFHRLNEDTLWGQVLEKYQVSHIIIDDSIINPARKNNTASQTPVASQALLKYGWKQVFKSGSLSVWHNPLQSKSKIRAIPNYLPITHEKNISRTDLLYSLAGSYISTSAPKAWLPWVNLDAEKIEDIKLKELDSRMQVTVPTLQEWAGKPAYVRIPKLPAGKELFGNAELTLENSKLSIRFQPLWEIDEISQKEGFSFEVDLLSPRSKIIVGIGGRYVTLENLRTVTLAGIRTVVGETPVLFIYDPINTKALNTKSFWTNSVNPCSSSRTLMPNQKIINTGAGREIRTQGIAACLPINIGNFSDHGLFLISVPFSSITNTQPDICVGIAGDNYECVHESISQEDIQNNQIKKIIPVYDSGDYWLDLITRSQPTTETVVQYSQPAIDFLPEIGRFPVIGFWEKNDASLQNIPLVPNKLTISLSTKKVILEPQMNPVELSNCDILKRGSVQSTNQSTGRRYIVANRGSICDVWSTPLQIKNDAVLRLTGHSQTKRGLKVSVYVPGFDKNMIDLLTPHQKEYDEYYGLLLSSNYSKFNVHTEAKSLDSSKEMETINEISMYPVPLEWVRNIIVTSTDKVFPDKSNITIVQANRINPAAYEIKINGNGLVEVGQAYEKGWIAWENFKPLEHIKVNGWANGWIIPDTKDKGQRNITIFYWPQLLEWFGLGIFAITTTWIGISAFIKRN